ncbi:acyltransferase [Microbacterium sp. APC 3898]|uniref:Acyltransferase n=1 Tax=Planococcus notacanthi TaxID=3035188 RepID=A0ABT7ZEU5_9BACL|nr:MULTISPECIES: acyltransferase [Terrabacteria group]MDN3425675.1 acyltransferase [Planococcus sp. APC 4016]MDN3500947.1 acyltransferase [Microbacterium sp. APC 3898]
MEYFYKIIKKIHIFMHKLLNRSIYSNGVILYGIPRMINSKEIIFEKDVRINDNVFLHGAGKIIVKENVTLSYGVSLISTGYSLENWEKNKITKQHINKKIIIGENVWLCANVTVLPGVTIAKDIVVAAGSVVTKDLLQSGYIYGGSPAKAIKKII